MRKVDSNRARGASSFALMVASCLLPTTLAAQDAENDAVDAEDVDQQADQQDADGDLNIILVNAQKRQQNMQDVPIAIIAVGGDQLARSGVVNTQDLKLAFPGVSIRTTGLTFQPSIRGIGTSSVSVENPVALYVDGVYYASQADGLRELNDLEQVAVLKGPQGTLFGRNATGGVIQITTREPSYDLEGKLSASIDNYETLRTGAYITGGLSDNVAASLSASYATQGEGWGNNITTGRETFRIDKNWSVRGKLLFEPGSSTRIMLIGDYTDAADNLGPYFKPFPGTRSGPPPLAPFYVAQAGVHDVAIDFDSNNELESGGVSLQIDQEFDFATLTSISAYRQNRNLFEFDADLTPNSVFNVSNGGSARSYSQELQLVSRSGSDLNWVVGAFYFNNVFRADPVQRFIGGPFVPVVGARYVRIDSAEKTESIAPFGQADFEVLPDTRLTLGLRWTYEKRSYVAQLNRILPSGAAAPTANFNPPSATVKEFTWRVALDHQFTPDILGYLSYNRGFKSGGFNTGDPTNAAYKPEVLDAYEGGLKTELFDGTVRFNTAAFYYSYSNVQVINLLNGSRNIANGAKAELYGLDTELEVQLTNDLRLSGGVSFLEAEFTSFPNAILTTPVAAGGLSSTIGSAAGNRLPLTPAVTGSIALDYSMSTAFGELDFNVTANHSGRYFFEPDNVTFQKAHQLVNLSVGWTSLDEMIALGVFVRNLLDEDVIAQSGAVPPIGYITTYTNPPRTFGVRASINF